MPFIHTDTGYPLGPFGYVKHPKVAPSEYGLPRGIRFGAVDSNGYGLTPPMAPDRRGRQRYGVPGRRVALSMALRGLPLRLDASILSGGDAGHMKCRTNKTSAKAVMVSSSATVTLHCVFVGPLDARCGRA